MNSLELIMFENSIDELIISDAYMLTVMEEKSSENNEGDGTNGKKKKKGKLKKAAKIVAMIALITTMIQIMMRMIKIDIDEEEKDVLRDSIKNGKIIIKEARTARKEYEKSPDIKDRAIAKYTRLAEAWLYKSIKLGEKYIKAGKVPADVKLNLQLMKKRFNELKKVYDAHDIDF